MDRRRSVEGALLNALETEPCEARRSEARSAIREAFPTWSNPLSETDRASIAAIAERLSESAGSVILAALVMTKIDSRFAGNEWAPSFVKELNRRVRRVRREQSNAR